MCVCRMILKYVCHFNLHSLDLFTFSGCLFIFAIYLFLRNSGIFKEAWYISKNVKANRMQIPWKVASYRCLLLDTEASFWSFIFLIPNVLNKKINGALKEMKLRVFIPWMKLGNGRSVRGSPARQCCSLFHDRNDCNHSTQEEIKNLIKPVKVSTRNTKITKNCRGSI